ATYLPLLKGPDFENAIPFMYLDTGGNVTVGVGNKLDTADDAKKLGFVTRADPTAKPPVAERKATDDEKKADFDNVKKQTANRVWTYYKQFTKLDLPDSEITSLLDARVKEFKTLLTASFPDFDSYPEEVCAAVFDMGFNLGVGKLTSAFPTFCKAVK